VDIYSKDATFFTISSFMPKKNKTLTFEKKIEKI
jgi:hypothetical protein